MNSSVEGMLKKENSEVVFAALELLQMGWAEGFFGNISLLSRIPPYSLQVKTAYPVADTIPIKEPMRFWVTRAGSHIEEIPDVPLEQIGLYSMEENKLRLLYGEGPPSSEVKVHILLIGTSKNKAVVHCHIPELKRLEGAILSGGLELPEGMVQVPYHEPGSVELAMATAEAMRKNRLVIWSGHGVISAGCTMQDAMLRVKELNYLMRNALPG